MEQTENQSPVSTLLNNLQKVSDDVRDIDARQEDVEERILAIEKDARVLLTNPDVSPEDRQRLTGGLLKFMMDNIQRATEFEERKKIRRATAQANAAAAQQDFNAGVGGFPRV